MCACMYVCGVTNHRHVSVCHTVLKCQPLGCHAQRRKACGRAGHGRGAYIVLEEVIAAGAAMGFISNLNGN
jgi:hypothetical protein